MSHTPYRSYNGRKRSDRVHAKRAGSNPETKARAAKKRETRLIVCLLIAAMFSITRLFFPSVFSDIKGSVSECLGGNVDLKSAVRVLGEAVSGEKEVYDAVAEAFSYTFGTEHIELELNNVPESQ